MGLTYGSLFTGIGGLDLGLDRAGWSCLWQVEKDPYCRRILERHWPHVERFADVCDVQGSQLKPVDLIAGGFPCQPVSRAGVRRRRLDERWLWPEFARLLSDLRPRFVLVENVPGLLDGGMGDVLGSLAELGYDAEWDCVPASVVGAPQSRERIFVVAYPRGFNGLTWGELGPSLVRQHERQSRGLAGLPLAGRGESASAWLECEPRMGRMAHGIPFQMDRLRVLGAAVVPQVGEGVGRLIAVVA